MAQRKPASNGHSGANGTGFAPRGAYEEAALGFRNYWYPVFSSREVTEKPKAQTLLGDPVVFMRRGGKAYAMIDECAHRGTQLSIGKYEFPGTNTITCRYHGWIYDVTNGMCVAVLCEGPESQVPGKVRIRTYPVEERAGIVWIWMGSMAPVPVEEDIPNLMLREDTIVKVRNPVKWGNWRWHAENVSAGHAEMVHRDTMKLWFMPLRAPRMPVASEYEEDEDAKGIRPGNTRQIRPTAIAKGSWQYDVEFPSLGRWPRLPWWRRLLFSWWVRPTPVKPVHGINSTLLMLPGIFRVPQFPNRGYMYYEWYVPVEADRYIYFQVTCMWARNPLHKLGLHLKYYLWTKPTGPAIFNNQDAAMVAQTTKYVNRTGNLRYLTKLSMQDHLHTVWRQYCDEQARGVGTAYQAEKSPAGAREPAVAGGAGE